MPSSQSALLEDGQDKRLRVARWVIGCTIILLYLAGLSPNWIIGGDSALYRLLARSLAEGKGYTTFGQPHAHVPPGFPMLLAAANALGLTAALWQNLIMLVIALATIFMVWRILELHGPPERVIWVLLLFALAEHVHTLSMELLSDMPCLALLALGLWLYIRWAKTGRGWPELGSLALIAAVWVRLAAGPVVAGVALGLLLQQRKPSAGRAWLNAGLVVVGLAATAAFFYAYYRGHAAAYSPSYGHHISRLTDRGAWDWLAAMGENFVSTGVSMARLFTSQRLPSWAAILLFWAPVLAGIGIRIRRNDVIATVATLACLAFFIFTQEPRARYLVPVSFLLMLYWSDALAWFFGLTALGRKALPYAAQVVLAGMAIASLPLDLRRIAWVHSDNFVQVYRADKSGKGEKVDQVDLAGWMRVHAGQDTRFFNASHAYALAWLSDVPLLPLAKSVTNHPPAPEEFYRLLRRQGATWIIFTSGMEKTPINDMKPSLIACGCIEPQPLFRNDSYEVHRILHGSQSAPASSADASAP